MSLDLAAVMVLILAAVVGAWRTLRSRRPARGLLVLAQFVVAAGLFLLLHPPAIPQPRETAIVLTPGADGGAIPGREAGFAIPGVEPTDPAIERVPDLATALRRHPRVGELRVLGDGLPARDRDAVGTLALRFEPGAAPVGVVELSVPHRIRAGADWSIRGRLDGVSAARIELRDRSDAIAASTTADAEGRFRMELVAKTAGQALYRLRVVDGHDALIEELPIGVDVRGGDSLRVLVVAGAADAELKYLRRWLLDAGHRPSSRIALSRGIEQLQDAAALDAGTLADADLLVLDERAWATLSSSEKSAIASAVEGGLGLLLRVTGPLPAQVRKEWEKLGIALESADLPRTVALPGDALPSGALSRWPMAMSTAESVPLQRAGDDSALGSWRASGQGRIGVWFLLDSYRLALGGETSRYGTLWSGILATLSRARGLAGPIFPDANWIDQRSVVCGIGEAASIEDAAGDRTALRIDPSTPGCAAWWPSRTGWSILHDGDSRWPVHVFGANEARSLLRTHTRDATARLAGNAPATTPVDADMPRWPLFCAWLLVAGLLWWLERRLPRIARASPTSG